VSERASAHAQIAAGSSVAHLSQSLARSFHGGQDRVVWNLADETVARDDQRLVRFDGQHRAVPAAAGLPTGAETSGPDAWLVLVENLRELAADDKIARLDAERDQNQHLLIVACELDEAESNAVARDRAAEHAARLRIDFVDPGQTSQADALDEVLDRVRSSGRATLLYWNARHAGPAPHFQPLPSEQVEAADFRQLATRMLAELAQRELRVETFDGAEMDAGLAMRLAIDAARDGKQVFVQLSLDQVLAQQGYLHREVLEDGVPLTLVLHDDHPARGSAALAGLRAIPGASLLSPKDGAELRRMLIWSAEANGLAMVWLPVASAPTLVWPGGEAIRLGTAEHWSGGSDVAIIAWGGMTAAATIAAESLGQRGIGCTVINARFAQPLDIAGLVSAAQQAACVVVVDDAAQSGGFAGWVVEALLHAGVARPVLIVAPAASASGSHLRYEECAMAITERCRWLAEPLRKDSDVTIAPETPIVISDVALAPGWFSGPVVGTSPVGDVQAQVLAVQFSPFIDEWVQAYSKVGTRDVYLWRWCLHGLGLTTLSCVAPELRQDLCDTKLLAVMYGVMLDDVADQTGHDEFLDALTEIIAGRSTRDFRAFSRRQQAYARFTSELWETFEQRLRAAPCYEQYQEFLAYDHRQILNTFAYSCMVNHHPAMFNVQEHDMYLPHNMQMMSFATMDLMCSPEFDFDELGKLREVIWHAQSMGRIGNLVSTWQREIADRDFTSGVFARALRCGDLTPEDLRTAPPEAIERAVRRGGHERYFLQKWEAHYRAIESLAGGLRSVDVGRMLAALESLVHMELCSRGLK